MRVAINAGIIGGGPGKDIGAVAVRVDSGKTALGRVQGRRRCSLDSEPEKHIAIAVGRQWRVDEDGGIVGGGVPEVIGERRVKDFLDRRTVRRGIGTVDVVNGAAGAGIIETSAKHAGR